MTKKRYSHQYLDLDDVIEDEEMPGNSEKEPAENFLEQARTKRHN